MRNPHPSLLPVSPNECALAVAIPLTREQFLADLSQLSGEKDFVHHFRTEKGLQKANAEFCWEVYEDDEAIFAKAVCDKVERLAVTVCYDARLDNLTDLLNRFRVVTLVTHGLFVPIEGEAILDAPKLLELLQSPQSQVQQSIRNALEILDSPLLRREIFAPLSGAELRNRIAEEISTICNEAERLYWDDAASQCFKLEQMLDGLSIRLTRVEFERSFPGCIAPARVVEFCDGLHTVPELIESVPEDFAGLLDLTVCNSVIPAGPIRLSRPNCLVAGKRGRAELRSGMYLYGLEISLLAKQPMPFVEVIKQAHLGKPACQTKGGQPCNLFGSFFNNIQGRR